MQGGGSLQAVGKDGSGYASLEEFVSDAVEIERGLVADAIRAGATSIQFDFPLYPYLVDPAWVARFTARGHRIEDLVDAAIAADTEVLRDIPDDVTVALHICRGNFRSSWMCEGSLEPLADRVFGALPYDAFLVECPCKVRPRLSSIDQKICILVYGKWDIR